jgi:hypothetical protein
MSLAGEFPHKIKAVYFAGCEGFLWVWIMGSQNVMGSGFGSNIREYEYSNCNYNPQP